jgi:GGDEF domain-containing protein
MVRLPLNTRRILAPENFFTLIDLEVKRARRYQNFFSLLILSLRPLSGARDGNGAGASYQKLVRVAADELRESDILGSLGPDKLGALLPYAEQAEGVRIQSRFQRNLRNYAFGDDGYEVCIDQISFPLDGTDTAGLLKRIVKNEPDGAPETG